MQELFKEVERLAEKKGLSICALERAAGLGAGTIRKWGTRIPRLASIQAVAGILGTTDRHLVAIIMKEIED